jgi:hypothetical protein
MSDKIPWRALPAYARRRVRDYGDVEEARDRIHAEAGGSLDDEWVPAWAMIERDRQQEIVEQIRIEMKKQLLEIEQLCC